MIAELQTRKNGHEVLAPLQSSEDKMSVPNEKPDTVVPEDGVETQTIPGADRKICRGSPATHRHDVDGVNNSGSRKWQQRWNRVQGWSGPVRRRRHRHRKHRHSGGHD